MKYVPSSTNIEEIDIKIYSCVPVDILFNLSQTNKYVGFICSNVWEIKINELYFDLPIPSEYKNNLGLLFYKISKSYVQLKNFATKNKYEKILIWLDIPINKINYLLEFIVNRTNFPGLSFGKLVLYRQKTFEEVKTFLEQGIYPTQKSINICIENGNLDLIDLLIDYKLFPDEEAINIAVINGYYSHKLIINDLFPDQTSINIGFENCNYSKNFGYCGLFPDQEVINIGAENGYYPYVLYIYNLFPEQESIDIGLKNGYFDDETLYRLCKSGKFPRQDAINEATKKGFYDLIKVLVDEFNLYPDQKTINYIIQKNDYKIMRLLKKRL